MPHDRVARVDRAPTPDLDAGPVARRARGRTVLERVPPERVVEVGSEAHRCSGRAVDVEGAVHDQAEPGLELDRGPGLDRERLVRRHDEVAEDVVDLSGEEGASLAVVDVSGEAGLGGQRAAGQEEGQDPKELHGGPPGRDEGPIRGGRRPTTELRGTASPGAR